MRQFGVAVPVLLIALSVFGASPASSAPPLPAREPAAGKAREGRDDVLVSLARGKGRVVIADFGLGLCRQCKAQAAILDKVGKVYGDNVVIRTVPVNKEQALTARYGVETIPHLVFLDPSGAVRLRRTGVMSFEEIAEQLRRMGVAP